MAREVPGRSGGPVTRALWSGATWLFVNLSGLVAALLFLVLNRTTVLGRDRVPRRRNTLLLSNHQSMIDSWLIGLAAYYPISFWRPYLIPWNPAAEENFFRHPAIRVISTLSRAIPIREGRRDIKALYRMIRALQDGTMILFPEGTRSRDGSIGGGRPGAGLVALGTHPTVIPVTIEGMDRVLPIGSSFPRFGHRIYVRFGQPVEYGDLLDRPRSKETAQELVDRVVERIREGQCEIRRHRQRREGRNQR